MKLRKQTGLKASILLATAGLLAAFYAIVRGQPHLGAAAGPPSSPPATEDRYRRFFAGQDVTSAPQPALPTTADRPHTRSRAS